jgi:hypothetical protein
MIYEIQVRPAANTPMSSDQLVWIESSLSTRAFEQWLISKSLLNGTGNAMVMRWSIVQSDRPAHFQLATQMPALEKHIAQLTTSQPEVREMPAAVTALRTYQFKGLRHIPAPANARSAMRAVG